MTWWILVDYGDVGDWPYYIGLLNGVVGRRDRPDFDKVSTVVEKGNDEGEIRIGSDSRYFARAPNLWLCYWTMCRFNGLEFHASMKVSTYFCSLRFCYPWSIYFLQHWVMSLANPMVFRKAWLIGEITQSTRGCPRERKLVGYRFCLLCYTMQFYS